MYLRLLTAFLFGVVLFSCEKSPTTGNGDGPKLIFKFKFDSTQVRLNNIGQPAAMPASNSGQSPVFNGMSTHYIEMTPSAITPLGQGAVLYHAPETTAGGATAIDFSKAKIAGNGEVFFEVPISQVPKGSYEWLRISLAYQNYSVKMRVDTTIAGIAVNGFFPTTVASFIGYNNYIQTLKIKDNSVAVNANKKQGFWGFETVVAAGGFAQTFVQTGQAPEGATTVPNPIFTTSPIPQGSCVVTASFRPGKLIINGNETKDIVVEASLSINKSFEWKDLNRNGLWEPLRRDSVVDMGIRGMIPTWN